MTIPDVAACTREPLAATDVNISGTQTVLVDTATSDWIRRTVLVSSASIRGDGTPEETRDQHLLTVRQVRDLTHVDDITEGTLRALTSARARTGTVNIGTGVATSIRDVADLVRAHFPGTALPETSLPAGDPLGGHSSVRRMENHLLSRRPQALLPNGVGRYVRWLRPRRPSPDRLRRRPARAAR
ncbi:NAD-dependent epimerase/dehydratase family protein [Streptomyces goshikiensis]|uniref:NAD-dependent epimerase/dehydratase family protein n=1 Tax=Streptomyces TaxID=1883 RepID=UPI001F23D22D|nr:hypothetical protein [Streptomyces sp. CB02120-2]